MELEISLDAYEGPLDLLLHLIDKNKVNIWDIPIASITDQYLACVRAMEAADPDLSSEFLVMGATLLAIKTRMLLPADEDGEEEAEDPRAELAARLLEYRQYKDLGTELKDMSVGSEQRFYKEQALPQEVADYRPPVDLDELLTGVTVKKLETIFRDVMRRIEDRADTGRPDYRKIRKEEVPISARIGFVRERIRHSGKLSFRRLLHSGTTRTEVIVTFLAILELMKTGEIRLTEDSTADDFTVEESNHEQDAG